MNTKKYIESTLMAFLKKRSIDKIKVNEIIRDVGTCKGTFYKYYRDKYELLLSCFQNNFYAEPVTAASDWESFMLECLNSFGKYPSIVLNAFKSEDINSINTFHEKLIIEYLEKDIRCKNVESVNKVNSFSIRMCAASYTNIMLKWLETGMKESKEELVTYMRAVMPQSIYPIVYAVA